jgi:hypothetical protein
MEIGLSTDQLIDIGLNMAGFLAAGLLLMLARSICAVNRFSGACAKPETNSSGPSGPATGRNDEPVPDIEFVDLKNVNWHGRSDSFGARSAGSFEDKGRREIIRIAKEVLAGKPSRQVSGPAREGAMGCPPAGGNLNLNGAGRSR